MTFLEYIEEVNGIRLEVSSYSSFSSSFVSAVKVLNDPDAEPEWVIAGYAKMLTSFAATLSDSGLVDFADKLADFGSLVVRNIGVRSPISHREPQKKQTQN